MRRCLQCPERFDATQTACPACGHAPEVREGVELFAPGLAEVNDGYPLDVEMPAADQDHFWRVARNRLFTWSLRSYFPDASSFLEIGCGTGGILRALTEEFPQLEVSGSEIFVAPLLAVRRQIPRARVQQVDARALPWRDEFDVIGAFDVIEHIDDDRAVVEEMFAAVRPGGGVMISVPQHAFLWSQRDVRLHHKRRYARRELEALIRATGFELLWSTSFMSLPFPLMLVQALRNKRARDDYDPHAELKRGALVNKTLGAVLTAERQLIKAGADFPVGGSLLAIGRRPA